MKPSVVFPDALSGKFDRHLAEVPLQRHKNKFRSCCCQKNIYERSSLFRYRIPLRFKVFAAERGFIHVGLRRICRGEQVVAVYSLAVAESCKKVVVVLWELS